MIKILYLSTLLLLILSSCHKEQTVPVEIYVDLQIEKDNNSSPLIVNIDNKTKSADRFLWTFEGGSPTTSSEKNPGKVIFLKAGEHTITLEAWNDWDRTSKCYTIRVDSMMSIDFKAIADINNYAPATFQFTNISTGASKYTWTFNGGTPAVYEGVNPPNVTYTSQGKYMVILEGNNGSETVTVSHEIEVRETMIASFEIIPSFEDIDDMEAPLRATFDVKLQGVETLQWECKDATITNSDKKEALIYFPKEGTYVVYLNVSNGKETKQIAQTITVKANTNLRTHNNIKLGINTAQDIIGSVYSTKLRRTFKSSDINEINGPSIDIAFMGLNSNFGYNYFVSPDNISSTPLVKIPLAQTTWFINKIENTALNLTETQFGLMNNDDLLKTIPIKENTNNLYFTNSVLPRIVLFETKDGRKGAIRIKEMVQQGKEGSYIIIDIKVQKND